MRELDYASFPLQGVSLIEASAGTGKTYSIVRIYLRHLMERDLTVEKIVVATFTKAATAELRSRIREGLSKAWQLASGNQHPADPAPQESDEEGLEALIAQAAMKQAPGDTDRGRKQVATRLRLALLGLDAAPIHTIDGLSLRWAREFALQAGLDLNAFEVTDGKTLLDTAMQRERIRLANSGDFADGYAMTVLGLPDHNGKSALAAWVRTVLDYGAERLQLAPGQGLRQQLAEKLEAWDQPRRNHIAGLIMGNVGPWFKVAIPRAYFANAEETAHTLALPEAVCRKRAIQSLAPLDKIANGSLDDWFTQSGLKKADVPRAEIEQLQALFRLALNVLWCDVHRAVLASAKRVEQSVARLKREQNLMPYSEVTRCIKHAIVANKGGIREHLLQRYPVALVDEFQDSSPDQAELFMHAYADSKRGCLTLIGDPKQAIYGFRGGDVFAYLSAKQRVDENQQFYLPKNYRSTQPYLDAINTLFDNTRDPFAMGDGSMEYRDVQAGDGWEERLAPGAIVRDSRAANTTLTPITVHQMPLGKRGVNTGSTHMAGFAGQVVDDWLQGALAFAPPAARNAADNRAIQPSDVAILVRTNAVAHQVYQALSTLGYPVVCQSEKGIFQSDEARELLQLLDACAKPGDETLLRVALSGDLMGLNLAQLRATLDDEKRWEEMLQRFAGFRDQWRNSGVLSLLYTLIAQRAAAFLRRPGGARILTNWLHLADLCQQAQQRHPTPSSLLQWLRQQIAENADSGSEASELLRLETDQKAIQIVTLHKCKGLEYPVVLLLDPWRSAFRNKPGAWLAPQQGPIQYHNAAKQRCLAFADSDREQPAQQAFREALQEDLRLAYVGLTRAKYHCAFLWGGDQLPKSIWESGFQWLVCDQDSRALDGEKPSSAHPMKRILNLDPERFSSSELRPESVSRRWTGGEAGEQDQGKALRARELGEIQTDTWAVTSFSAIKRGAVTDHNASWQRQSDEVTSGLGTEGSPADRPVLFAVPGLGGIAFGNAFHALMEHVVDNRATTLDTGVALAREQLIRYGIQADGQAAHATWDLVQRVLNTPLLPDGECTLGNLAARQKIPEMEFNMCLGRTAPAQLADCLEKDPRWAAFHGPTAQLLRRRTLPLHGLLHGFIDLTFCWQGKYYLLDYKTNTLGNHLGYYTRSAMDRAMQYCHYDLQYLIYTVALHRWLGQVLGGYDYASQFGGVLYLFVRGMNEQGREGIWFQRPPEELVFSMDALLLHDDHRGAA